MNNENKFTMIGVDNSILNLTNLNSLDAFNMCGNLKHTKLFDYKFDDLLKENKLILGITKARTLGNFFSATVYLYIYDLKENVFYPMNISIEEKTLNESTFINTKNYFIINYFSGFIVYDKINHIVKNPTVFPFYGKDVFILEDKKEVVSAFIIDKNSLNNTNNVYVEFFDFTPIGITMHRHFLFKIISKEMFDIKNVFFKTNGNFMSLYLEDDFIFFDLDKKEIVLKENISLEIIRNLTSTL